MLDSPRTIPMADAPYLIALALLEQQGERAMPLQGKSLRQAIGPNEDPGEVAEQLIYGLLLRVWERSDQGALRRADAERSLLLVQVPIEALQDTLPDLKAAWIGSGNTEVLLRQLAAGSSGIWRLELPHRQAPRFTRLEA